ADLVVARAGGSVWEIAAAGRPAILVPYPDATADHQRRNAEYFERAGGALVVDDADASTAVPRLVDELLADPERMQELAEAMRAAAKPDAADRIADELLAELVSLRQSIVVAGAHGKTTTSGMIAFCLQRLGCDPAFLIGGEIPQLGGNAGAGTGWLVVEGDESDRSVAETRPDIAVLLNVDLDHHATFGTRAEVAALFEE